MNKSPQEVPAKEQEVRIVSLPEKKIDVPASSAPEPRIDESPERVAEPDGPPRPAQVINKPHTLPKVEPPKELKEYGNRSENDSIERDSKPEVPTPVPVKKQTPMALGTKFNGYFLSTIRGSSEMWSKNRDK